MVVIKFSKGQHLYFTPQQSTEPADQLGTALFQKLAGELVVTSERWYEVIRPELRDLGIASVLISDQVKDDYVYPDEEAMR